MAAGALLAALSACAPPGEGSAASARQAIYGGTPAPDAGAVFLIESAGGFCTASLIAPRTLLTASHCFGDGQFTVANAPSSNEVYTSVEAKRWVDYRVDAGPADLALILLDRAPAVQPLRWSWSPRRIVPGVDRMRHIGYGRDEYDDFGTRREVVTEITGFEESQWAGLGIKTGNALEGICNGDSGGPGLLVAAAGGYEAVTAVHSYGWGACGPGVSVLIYPYRAFIEDWLRTHEGPTCARDDRCVQGCEPLDPDCACAADGFCTSQCEDLVDPDCPASCRTDGVCSDQLCPRLDEDCNPPGVACLRPTQCEGRLCISDAQNPSTYCSAPCAGGCPAGLECDAARGLCVKHQLPNAALGAPCNDAATFCLGGACVDGLCRASCTSNLDCGARELCRVELPRVCMGRTVVLDRLELEGPAAEEPRRCEATGALPLVALALALGLRRRAHTR